MIENINVRQATFDDVDFIIEAIVESEKSSSDVISSCNVFGLSEERFKEIIRKVLLENVPNYDYYLSGFILAEKGGEYIGAMGSWIEAAEGVPSGVIKTTILFPYLDKDKMRQISKNASIVKGLTMNREPGTLQLEHDYTRKQYRRQGVFTRLIKENILRNMKEHDEIEKAQVALFKANYKSLNVHLKLGFKIVEEKHVDNPEIFKFFPFDTKVLLELNKEKFSMLKLD
jgi:RimJ/RimL family protein N-acetyltransferase